MSADNTILILKLQDEYKVGHFQGADNLYWSWKNGLSDSLVNYQLFLFFENRESIQTKSDALMLASKLYDEIGYVEYGIQTLVVNKTWIQVLQDAIDEIYQDIEFVLGNPEFEDWDFEKKTSVINDLRKVLNDINEKIKNNG